MAVQQTKPLAILKLLPEANPPFFLWHRPFQQIQRLRNWTWFRFPDVARVFFDRPVA
jgi:hypothetical protein